jgi:hypothetical protein
MSNEMAVHETQGSVPARANVSRHAEATRALYDHPARRLR